MAFLLGDVSPNFVACRLHGTLRVTLPHFGQAIALIASVVLPKRLGPNFCRSGS
jgi:hypothetical protein